METQFEGPISGQLQIELFESGGSAPVTTIRLGQEFLMRATLRLESRPLTIKLDRPGNISKLMASFYLESLGPGSSYTLTSDQELWITGKKIYEFQVSLPSEKLGIGIFRVTVAVTGMDDKGGPLPMIWYQDGPLFQTYS